jgi:hypothetical protein|eukprot:COSAG03_NODE_2579_length_2628_cov_7.403717_3_plen_140_part_00
MLLRTRTTGGCGIADEVAAEPGEDYPEPVGGNCEPHMQLVAVVAVAATPVCTLEYCTYQTNSIGRCSVCVLTSRTDVSVDCVVDIPERCQRTTAFRAAARRSRATYSENTCVIKISKEQQGYSDGFDILFAMHSLEQAQ